MDGFSLNWDSEICVALLSLFSNILVLVGTLWLFFNFTPWPHSFCFIAVMHCRKWMTRNPCSSCVYIYISTYIAHICISNRHLSPELATKGFPPCFQCWVIMAAEKKNCKRSGIFLKDGPQHEWSWPSLMVCLSACPCCIGPSTLGLLLLQLLAECSTVTPRHCLPCDTRGTGDSHQERHSAAQHSDRAEKSASCLLQHNCQHCTCCPQVFAQGVLF